MKTKETREDITLRDGTIIKHRREANGSQFAYEAGREVEAMSEEHWLEYCSILSSGRINKAIGNGEITKLNSCKQYGYRRHTFTNSGKCVRCSVTKR